MNHWSDINRATNAQILAWADAQPWARAMAACQQDAQWHAEGDVCELGSLRLAVENHKR